MPLAGISAWVRSLHDRHDVPPVAGSVARDYGWQGLRDDYAKLLS
jgi:hypothetical protein